MGWFDQNCAYLKDLIGRRVTGLFVSQGEADLRFTTDADYEVKVSTDADCCSETWFADIIGVDNLLQGVVSEAVDLEVQDYNVEDGRGRQDSDNVYGVRVVTDKGHCDIIFRNSSNGYYGGSLTEFMTGPWREEREWKEITEDWQA